MPSNNKEPTPVSVVEDHVIKMTVPKAAGKLPCQQKAVATVVAVMFCSHGNQILILKHHLISVGVW